MILWADRTTPKNVTNETPDSLVFVCTVVICAEVYMPTTKYGLISEEMNDAELSHELDTIDKIRYATKLRMTTYQQTIARSYNKDIKI